MITILATVMLSQLTTSPAMGLFEVRNMIQATAGQRDSWDYTTNQIRGFRSMAPQTKAKTKSKSTEKIECGENCLCTKLTEQEVKDILTFIQQQKERQAQMERFRQQNPNGQIPPNGFGGFRGRPQNKQAQPNGVD